MEDSINQNCYYCDFCYYCYYCYYCKNLKMTEYNIFCYAKEYNDSDSFQQERYRAFNKVVGEERYQEIKDLIKNNILKDFKLELNKNNWKDEWKKVTKEQWLRMKNEILEFSQEIVENIIGFKLDLDSKEEDKHCSKCGNKLTN